MMGSDAYAVLGLRPGADRAEVDQAYRRLIKRYHPDSAGGDSNRAAELNRAYSELRSRTRQPQAPPRPQAPAMARQLRSEGGSGWRGPVFALAALAVALVMAASAAMMETVPWSPQLAPGTPAAAEGDRAAVSALSLDSPLSTDLIDASVGDALRLHAAGDPVLAAEFSNQCLGRLGANPSLPLFDSCVAYDEAIAILGVDNTGFESGPFNPSAITARQVGAGRLLSADYLESESRLQQIRSRVHLILLPKIPDAGRASERRVAATAPTQEYPEPPAISTAVQPQIEPRSSLHRRSVQDRPRLQRREVAAQRRAAAQQRPPAQQRTAAQQRRQAAAPARPAAPPAAAESRKVPAWQQPIKPAWQRPMSSPPSGS